MEQTAKFEPSLHQKQAFDLPKGMLASMLISYPEADFLVSCWCPNMTNMSPSSLALRGARDGLSWDLHGPHAAVQMCDS